MYSGIDGALSLVIPTFIMADQACLVYPDYFLMSIIQRVRFLYLVEGLAKLVQVEGSNKPWPLDGLIHRRGRLGRQVALSLCRGLRRHNIQAFKDQCSGFQVIFRC